LKQHKQKHESWTFNAPESSLMPFFLTSLSLLEMSVALDSPCKFDATSCPPAEPEEISKGRKALRGTVLERKKSYQRA